MMRRGKLSPLLQAQLQIVKYLLLWLVLAVMFVSIHLAATKNVFVSPNSAYMELNGLMKTTLKNR